MELFGLQVGIILVNCDGTTINRLNPVQVIHSNGTPLIGVKEPLPEIIAVYLMEDGTSVGERNNNGQFGDGRYWIRTQFKLKFLGESFQ